MRPRVDFSSRRALATSSWDASGLTFAFVLVLALRAVIAIVADVTVPVASGRELVAALAARSVGTVRGLSPGLRHFVPHFPDATNQLTSVIHHAQIEVTALDVTVPDSLFGGLLDGGATGTPLLLDRNVTVVGGAGLPDMPILRLQATRALKLGRNVSLTFENVSLVTPSIDNLAWVSSLVRTRGVAECVAAKGSSCPDSCTYGTCSDTPLPRICPHFASPRAGAYPSPSPPMPAAAAPAPPAALRPRLLRRSAAAPLRLLRRLLQHPLSPVRRLPRRQPGRLAGGSGRSQAGRAAAAGRAGRPGREPQPAARLRGRVH